MFKLRHQFFRLSFTRHDYANYELSWHTTSLLQNSACHLHPCTWKSIPNEARRDSRCTRWENAHKRFHSFIPQVSIFNHSHKFVINSRGNDRSPIRAETWLSPWIVFPILHSPRYSSRYAHWIANQPTEITNLSHLEKQFFPIARLNEIKECLLL